MCLFEFYFWNFCRYLFRWWRFILIWKFTKKWCLGNEWPSIYIVFDIHSDLIRLGFKGSFVNIKNRGVEELQKQYNYFSLMLTMDYFLMFDQMWMSVSCRQTTVPTTVSTPRAVTTVDVTSASRCRTTDEPVSNVSIYVFYKIQLSSWNILA